MGQDPEVIVEANPKEVAPRDEVTVTVRLSEWSEDLRYFIEDWDVDEGSFAPSKTSGGRTIKEPRSFKDQVATAVWIAPDTIGEHAITVTVRAVKKGDPDEQVVWRESGSDEIEVVGAVEKVEFAFEDCPDDRIEAIAGDIVCVVADVPDAKRELDVVNVDVSHGNVTTIERDESERARFRIHVQLDDDTPAGEHTFEIRADFAPPEPARPGTTPGEPVPAKRSRKQPAKQTT